MVLSPSSIEYHRYRRNARNRATIKRVRRFVFPLEHSVNGALIKSRWTHECLCLHHIPFFICTNLENNRASNALLFEFFWVFRLDPPKYLRRYRPSSYEYGRKNFGEVTTSVKRYRELGLMRNRIAITVAFAEVFPLAGSF